MNNKGEKINHTEIIKSCRQFHFKVLLQQLGYGTSVWWSWGGHAFRAESNEYTKYFRMTVQGHHHKGHVWIFLNGLDLYDVYFTSRQGTIKEIKTNLYDDMIHEVVDNYVERIPDYKF